MRFVFFVHSIASDWNHGNAHFLRGLMSSLARLGHRVQSWEPRHPWSLENMLKDHGVAPVVEFGRAFPEIEVHNHCDGEGDDEAGFLEELHAATSGADVVVVHEWNSPALVNALGRIRSDGADFLLLFHDTHHRPWSEPERIARFELSRYDGVIAFGEVLRQIYLERFRVRRAWTMHEAADLPRFHPLEREKRQDVVWIGNWGDGERSGELRRFWLDSARMLKELRFAAYGVRYPADALAEVRAAGVDFRGWAPSLTVPEIFASSLVTLHVPRQAYVQALRGIPTIRVFEALACGIPLVSSPWLDTEGLFRPGDFRTAHTPAEMRAALRELARDPVAREEQAARGLETILERHTCDHRAAELLGIVDELRAQEPGPIEMAPQEAACA